MDEGVAEYSGVGDNGVEGVASGDLDAGGEGALWGVGSDLRTGVGSWVWWCERRRSSWRGGCGSVFLSWWWCK